MTRTTPARDSANCLCQIGQIKFATFILDLFDLSRLIQTGHPPQLSGTSYDDLVIKLLPDGTPFIAENIYETILNATCFVASLTDSKAMHIAEKIGLK